MDKKKIIILTTVFIIAGLITFVTINKIGNESESNNQTSATSDVNQAKQPLNKKLKKNAANYEPKPGHKTKIKSAPLYDSSTIIPLSGIAELADLPQNIRHKINNYIDNSVGIFMLKRKGDKVTLITENPDNIRHGIDFVEFSIPTGHQNVSTLGYNGKIQDSENEKWEYNENALPLKHTKYDKDGNIEFTETWNYDSSNPIKYEMKNNEDKTIAMRKETITDGSNMRVEQLLYDSEGTTIESISIAYEGSDIKRFTYYNADKPSEGASVFCEYENGNKVKESVYTSDLKLENVYEANYTDGERESISVHDKENNLVETIKNNNAHKEDLTLEN